MGFGDMLVDRDVVSDKDRSWLRSCSIEVEGISSGSSVIKLWKEVTMWCCIVVDDCVVNQERPA
jgi:hypothetical protein